MDDLGSSGMPAMDRPDPGPPVPQASSSPGAIGLVYADVPNRAVAYIIDAIVVGILFVIAAAVLGAIGLVATTGVGLAATTNWFATIILTIAGLAISGAYFIYSWTRMRATLGMRALGMQIGNAGDGKTLTMDQAVRRFLALGAIFSIAQGLNPLPLLGVLIAIASLAWVIFLIYTTAKSPTKQGWHDVFANSAVVKTARTAV